MLLDTESPQMIRQAYWLKSDCKDMQLNRFIPICIFTAALILLANRLFLHTQTPDCSSSFDPKKVSISTSQLLSRTGWSVYRIHDANAFFEYPPDWHLIPRAETPQELANRYPKEIFLSTSESGNSYDFDKPGTLISHVPWARITIGVSRKDPSTSLLEWLKDQPSGPGVDESVQIVRLATRDFIGTCHFLSQSEPNAYFETPDRSSVIKLSLQREDPNNEQNSLKIYLTMLKSLMFSR